MECLKLKQIEKDCKRIIHQQHAVATPAYNYKFK